MKAKVGQHVTYYPNENDNQSRPKGEPVPGVVVSLTEVELPTEKDEKGHVTATRKVPAANIVLFQDNAAAPIMHRKEVVSEEDAHSKSLKYKLAYWASAEPKAPAKGK